MQSMLEYRSGIADVRHPWLAAVLAAGIGLVWGIAPVSVLLATGESAGSGRVLFLAAWCAVVGVVAGLCTVWTRGRNGGAETPIALVGTYYLAIVVFWIGFSLLEGAEWIRSGWPVLNSSIVHSFCKRKRRRFDESRRVRHGDGVNCRAGLLCLS